MAVRTGASGDVTRRQNYAQEWKLEVRGGRITGRTCKTRRARMRPNGSPVGITGLRPHKCGNSGVSLGGGTWRVLPPILSPHTPLSAPASVARQKRELRDREDRRSRCRWIAVVRLPRPYLMIRGQSEIIARRRVYEKLGDSAARRLGGSTQTFIRIFPGTRCLSSLGASDSASTTRLRF
jgi:hypothetical protein